MTKKNQIHFTLADMQGYLDSEQISPERLDGLVTRLREGDKSVVTEIIIGHLRLVMKIVGRRALGKGGDDTIGAALLALTEAVNKAPTALYDNNITAYITTMVKYGIKTAHADNHTIRVPSRTVRHKIAQGLTFEECVPGNGISIVEDPKTDEGSGTQSLAITYDLPYHVPIAKTCEPSIEFKEALHRAIETPIEAAVVNLRIEGYGYMEIGQRVGYSKSVIGEMIPKIEARFNKYYKKS